MTCCECKCINAAQDKRNCERSVVDEKEFANSILEETKNSRVDYFCKKITYTLELSLEKSVETRSELRLFD